MKQTQAMHHFHKERPQSNDLRVIWVDRLMYFFGIIAPLMTVPQIYKIWTTKEAIGVSALSWAAYALGSFAWFVYGVVHKEKPIIIANGASMVLQLIVVIGTLRFA